MSRLVVICGTFLMLMGFQNCSDVAFDSADSDLIAKTETDPGFEEEVPTNEEEDEHGEHTDHKKDCKSGGYICILDGPGSSVRLGLINENLAANGNTPDTVCMSKSACEDIVAQKFTVKGPKKGPCKNPHTVSLTDTQLQSLVDKL